MRKDCANSIESLCLLNFSPPPEQPLSPFRHFSPPLPSKNPDTLLSFHFDRENAKAKKCLKNLLRSQCTFSSSDQELIDLGFNDYNPFCKNNRDPEATGNDQCFGVKDLGNPLNNSAETAGMRLQALLVPFLLLFFFV